MMFHDPFLFLFALIGSHLLLDYALQGPFMSEAKNPTKPIPGIDWRVIMASHAFIHGTAVALLTGHPILGLLETGIHFVTDKKKCEDKITFVQDQCIHVICKLIWFTLTLVLHLVYSQGGISWSRL